MTAPEHHASAGFTLLESLIAFLIAAGGLAAIYSSHSTSLQGREKAENRLKAILVAEDVLARAGTEYPLADGTYNGNSGAVSWSMRIASGSGEAASLNGLWLVTVTAMAGNIAAVSLETLRFGARAS